ncbi:hypothetical protein SAMN05216548_11346 [Faunimonas pinastri]|uniref:DUF1737 domain-containing protein n=1 Tax=Faunimonas pinastri TaxID=1855383 RepID=A0A1H9MBP2_9HYPH|nr:DUF1737 domain-containing protein [Faunimonas pinastri]SER21021.1 hypothetical protein SAMN05216548_11346 [Faunimonas pinastri]
MKAYRFITGPDDASFCKRVTEALNKGWTLHGSPSLGYDMANARLSCGQAVVKEVEGEWTEEMLSEDFKLGKV